MQTNLDFLFWFLQPKSQVNVQDKRKNLLISTFSSPLFFFTFKQIKLLNILHLFVIFVGALCVVCVQDFLWGSVLGINLIEMLKHNSWCGMISNVYLLPFSDSGGNLWIFMKWNYESELFTQIIFENASLLQFQFQKLFVDTAKF